MARSRLWRLLAAFLLITAAAPAAADEIDDALGGFDELDEELAPDDTAPNTALEARVWDLTGSVGVGTSINFLKHDAEYGAGRSTDYGGIQRLRTRLNLQLDVDLPGDWKGRVAGFGFYDWAYFANGRRSYSDDVIDQYEWEVDFQEVWVLGSPFEDFDLKIGRQVVNWGRSDNLRVTDVLNPLDNREPGLVDIEDLRRPVAMVKGDWYIGRWSFSAIAIPEIRFDLNPPLGSDFATFTSSLGTAETFVVSEEIPDESFDNTEWAFAINGIFSGWDASFYFSRTWRDTPYLRPVLTVTPGPVPTVPPSISLEGSELRHSRLTLVGAGANYTIGSWLLKGEIAWIDGIHYTTSTPVDLVFFGGTGVVEVPTGNVQKSRLDAMGGVEYYGFSNTSVAVEVVSRHIFGFRDDMRALFGDQENRLETALRITRNFLNERLELSAVGIVLGNRAQDGSVVRLEARFDLRDALEVAGGVVFYQKGDPVPFDQIARNDRLFFEVKYSF